MQAARRLTRARVGLVSTSKSFQTHASRTFSHIQGAMSNGIHTVNLVNEITWKKIGAKSAYYSSSSSSSISDPVIELVDPEPRQRMVKVKWKDGGEDVYPFIWLRDNCQCPECFHPVSLARRMLLKDLCLSITGTKFKISNNGDQLEIEWSDGHLGIYNARWLRERSFNKTYQDSKDNRYKLEPHQWGHELQNQLPRASFAEILNNDGALLNFLEDLEVLGVVVVSGVPTEEGQIHHIAHRVGYLKPCHYGETFIVKNRVDPNNLAYTSDALDMHTDLPCMISKPQIQMLHCIKQYEGKGGENELVDGFNVLTKLREKKPKYFDLLCKVLVDFEDVGVDDGNKFHVAWRAPTIDLYPDGSFKTINWHQMSRSSRFTVHLDLAEQWYEAMLFLRDIMQDPENTVRLKLKEGDMIVFDNLRLLHGRTGYHADSGERVLQGGYVEWDSVRSLRRVLRQEMAN